MTKTYNAFVGDLITSQDAVMAIAKYLVRERQLHVHLPPVHVRPETGATLKAYQDECDLWVSKDGFTEKIPVQVKGSSRYFGSVDDFEYSMITVDERYKIEAQEDNPPLCYYIVSKTLNGAMVIPWSTKKYWDIFEAPDPKQGGRLCSYYRCPKEHCQWRYLGTT